MTKAAPLSLVSSSPSASSIDPPRKLGKAGMELWSAITNHYSIEDAGGVEMLMQAAHTADRIAELCAAIAEDGPVLHTKTGVKSNPAIRDELQARAFVVRTLERLGLNLEALKPGIGRPPSFNKDQAG